jgi:predicted amidophosphoribosyltransferase
MSLEETFANLSAFLNSLDAEGEQKFELSHSLVIICPDCGKNIAFRGRCPKCGGNSWIPAGHAGGVFERMKAQRWRELMAGSEDEPVPRRTKARRDDQQDSRAEERVQ